MNTRQPVTREIADFTTSARLQDVSDDAVGRAKHIILDGIGCGLVGAKLPWSARAVEALADLEGGQGAAVWGWGIELSPASAAMVNGSFVQGFELDDYHEYGPVHSASICVPSALATAQRIGSVDGATLLMACLIGFEVGPRLGMAMGGYRMIERGLHCGAFYGTVSSAIASSRVRALSTDQTEDALGIAATQASGLMAAQFEAMVKRMHHGFASRSGVLGAGLAAHGYTGIKRVIEREYGGLIAAFCPDEDPSFEQLTGDLGTRWELMNIAIKPYASMGGLHPTIAAVLGLRTDNAIDPAEVESVEVFVGQGPYKHGGWTITRPITEIGAQMNLAYAAAIALVDGEVGVAQFRPERLEGADVWAIIDRTKVTFDEEVDELARRAQRPRATRVRITLRDSSVHEEEVLAAPGSGLRPLSNEEIRTKFHRLTSAVLDEDRRERIEELVLSLDLQPNVDELVSLLSAPVAPALGEPQ